MAKKHKKHAPKGPVKSRRIRVSERRNLMDAVDPVSGRPRCTATSKQTHKRCGRAPIVGGTVCRFHGGGAPQVRMVALDRLRQMQPKALLVLEELLDRDEYPTVQMAAVRDVLDRTEGRAAETVTVKSLTEQPLDKLSDEEFAKTYREGVEKWERHVAARERIRKATE